MQSPPSPPAKDKELLRRVLTKREEYLRSDLSNRLKEFCLSFLFGWKDSALKADIVIGVDRRECLLTSLEEVTEYVRINYKEKANERKD